MKNSDASSSNPRGKRPMTAKDLESLEKVTNHNNRVKRIEYEAGLLGISYDDCKAMVDIDEADLEKRQNMEDELLAKALTHQIQEDEAELVKRQIEEDEMLSKVLIQLEENELPKREESNLSRLSQQEEDEEDEDPTIQLLTRRRRSSGARENSMQESRFDRTSNPRQQ